MSKERTPVEARRIKELEAEIRRLKDKRLKRKRGNSPSEEEHRKSSNKNKSKENRKSSSPTTSTNKTITDVDGYRLTTKRKTEKGEVEAIPKIKKKFASSEPEPRLRRIIPWQGQLPMPEAKDEEWANVLEEGLGELGEQAFEMKTLSTNPNNRQELKQTVEYFLGLLHNDRTVIEDVFFGTAENKWHKIVEETPNSEYLNFRLILSAYVVKITSMLMREHININDTMWWDENHDDYGIALFSQTHIFRYLSAFNYRYVFSKKHDNILNEIMEGFFDGGSLAWDAYMIKITTTYKNREAKLRTYEQRRRSDRWKEYKGDEKFGRVCRTMEEQSLVEVTTVKGSTRRRNGLTTRRRSTFSRASSETNTSRNDHFAETHNEWKHMKEPDHSKPAAPTR